MTPSNGAKTKPQKGTLFPYLLQGKRPIQRISRKFAAKCSTTDARGADSASTLTKGSQRWIYIKDVVTASFKGKHGPPVFKVSTPQKVTHYVKPP